MLNPYVKNVNAYKNNEILTAPPDRLMIMMFDGALQFLFKARKGIKDKVPADVCNNIIGCQKILRELMKTIDLENGNDVGKHLFVFYDGLVKELYKVNRNHDEEQLNKVVEDLKNIRTAFMGAMEIVAKEKAEQQPLDME